MTLDEMRKVKPLEHPLTQIERIDLERCPSHSAKLRNPDEAVTAIAFSLWSRELVQSRYCHDPTESNVIFFSWQRTLKGEEALAEARNADAARPKATMWP